MPFSFLFFLLCARTMAFEPRTTVVIPPRKMLSRENLLWSPRVLRRTAMHVAWIGAARMACGNSLMEAAQRMSVWTTVSLLSSSCCLIQVVLNFLSLGCAGFAVLGPVRPLCLAAQAHMSLSARDPLIAAVALCVALSPELLVLSGKMRPRRTRKIPSPEATNSVTISLPTMGCVACVDAVSRALRKVPNVKDVHVALSNEGTQKGGRATVAVARIDDATMHELQQACISAGFPTEASSDRV